MKKLDKILDAFENASFVILLSVMTVIVFVQVIFRYIIHSSIPWSEELSRYCMVYVTFIGVSAGLKAGTHTGVDVVVEALHGKAKFVLKLIQQILVFVLTVLFFFYSVKYFTMLLSTGQKSATLHIPIAFAYFAMTIGFAGGIIRCIQNFVKLIREERQPKAEV